MKLNRIMVAAPKSGSGKTTITCGLLNILKHAGQNMISYKCGPDYIDPMFHQRVLGVPSKNLDTFFTGEKETRALFLNNRTEQEFAILEGVMGLYDGVGGVREEGSSYHLAKVTKTPIILVVDAKGMGRSMIALIAGFLNYDQEHLIRGVILNKISQPYFEIMKPLIENELKLMVLGYVPECEQFRMESRHLGLVMPNEIDEIREKLNLISEKLQKTISMESVIRIAETAEELECEKKVDKILIQKNCPVFAVARDEAFCFYYEDNLNLLKEYGADIKSFSPLHDKHLPEECCAILFGGGYPELYAEALSQNKSIHAEIKKAFENEMPIVAECGGFMYLHTMIEDKNKQEHTMVGMIPAKCCYTGKLVRFGYVELEEIKSDFLPEGGRIKGHEFHYFDSEDNGRDCLAMKPNTGKTYPCIKKVKNSWIGFPHLYYPSNPSFAENFVKKAREYKNIRT